MEYQETLKVGQYTYKIFFKLHQFGHLCTFLELSNINLAKCIKNPTFDTLQDVTEPFDQKDFDIFTYMFYRKVQNRFEGKFKGFLTTIGTGNRARWIYVLDQQKTILPFLNQLPICSKTVLYSDPINNANCVPGTEEQEGYEEITQYNICRKGLAKLEFTKTKKYIDKQNQVADDFVPAKILTKENVIKYVRGTYET